MSEPRSLPRPSSSEAELLRGIIALVAGSVHSPADRDGLRALLVGVDRAEAMMHAAPWPSGEEKARLDTEMRDALGEVFAIAARAGKTQASQ
jgi:hypothetical protein